MSAPVIDKTVPLNLFRVELEEVQGHTVARCKGCNAWLKISNHYQAGYLVIRYMQHVFPCPNYEAFIAEWVVNQDCAKYGQLVDRNFP